MSFRLSFGVFAGHWRSASRGTLGKGLAGDKKRAKKAKTDAKRAARAANQGVDLASINEKMKQLVLSQGDMLVGLSFMLLEELQRMEDIPCSSHWAGEFMK